MINANRLLISQSPRCRGRERKKERKKDDDMIWYASVSEVSERMSNVVIVVMVVMVNERIVHADMY